MSAREGIASGHSPARRKKGIHKECKDAATKQTSLRNVDTENGGSVYGRRFKRVAAKDCWPQTSDKEGHGASAAQKREQVCEKKQMQGVLVVLLHGVCFTSVAVPLHEVGAGLDIAISIGCS